MKRYFIALILTLGLISNVAAQKALSLKECLELGLQQNYDLLIVRNKQQIADNNASLANAGMLPTLDLSAGYSGSIDQTHTTTRQGESLTNKGAYDQAMDVGVSLGWTIFDGFRLSTSYKKLQELISL